jgi:hypothetical protein
MTRDAKEPDRENRYFNPFKFYLFSCCLDYTKIIYIFCCGLVVGLPEH